MAAILADHSCRYITILFYVKNVSCPMDGLFTNTFKPVPLQNNTYPGLNIVPFGCTKKWRVDTLLMRL